MARLTAAAGDGGEMIEAASTILSSLFENYV